MEVEVGKRSLAKALNSERELPKRYGRHGQGASRTACRLAECAQSRSRADGQADAPAPAEGTNRADQFAVDLVHPYRLVFKPKHTPIPRRDDGGMDTQRVTAITVIDVVDYH